MPLRDPFLELPGELTPRQLEAYRDAARVWNAQHGPPTPYDLNNPDLGDDLARCDVPPPGTWVSAWVRGGEGEGEVPWGYTPGKRGGGRGKYARSVRIQRQGLPGTCGVLIERGQLRGERCTANAGANTIHEGVGRCWAHRGNRLRERLEGAWLVAHLFAQELDVTPWEGLLRAVRIAAGKVAYCEWVLSQATSDLELEGRFGRQYQEFDSQGRGVGVPLLLHPDTGEPIGAGQLRDLSWWVTKSELWHDRLTKTSKMAIDAGVARWQIERAEQEAHSIARVLNAVLEGIDGTVDEATLHTIRTLMRRELMAMEAENAKNMIEAVPDPDRAP